MDDEAGMLAPIEGALPKIKPLTPVQRRRLESAAAIADDPPEGITYQHTVLCQTSLPYRDQGDSTRVWERRQGAVLLALEAGRVYDRVAQRLVEVGLPYGSRPRLILAHLNREALLHGSPRIEVESSLTAFIRRVVPENSSPRGIEIRRFKDQLSRFAASLVRMVADLPDDRAYQVDTKIIDFMELWGGKDERQRVLWPAVVELSPRYFASLTKHAVPLDERAIGALANSPMALDVYAWLAQRLHRVEPRRPQFITWVSVQQQFGQGFARLRDFRRAFLDVLDTVHAQYRAARVEADERGITLRCSPPPVKGRLVTIQSQPAERLAPVTTKPAPTIEQVVPPPDSTRIQEHGRGRGGVIEDLLRNVRGDRATCTYVLSDGTGFRVTVEPMPGVTPTLDLKTMLQKDLDELRQKAEANKPVSHNRATVVDARHCEPMTQRAPHGVHLGTGCACRQSQQDDDPASD